MMRRLNLFRFLLLLCWGLALSLSSRGATVDTINVFSKAMRKELKAAVVLPKGYRQAKKSYPVLYLLHGGSGSFRDWLTKTPDRQLLHRLSDQYGLVIVTPEGGFTSYYFDSPVDKESQFETFITREVPDRIEQLYRVIPERKGRVIAGLSMGGHGAVFLATRHPDRYCAAGSMSGVMNINTATWKVDTAFAQLRAKNFARLLGPPKDSITPYPGYTAVELTEQIKSNRLPLMIDCGVDDFLIGTNRDLHQRLLANQTPHDYIERPGAHTWEYWQNALPYQVLFLTRVLKANGVEVP